jgi:hypothetical protein
MPFLLSLGIFEQIGTHLVDKFEALYPRLLKIMKLSEKKFDDLF